MQLDRRCIDRILIGSDIFRALFLFTCLKPIFLLDSNHISYGKWINFPKRNEIKITKHLKQIHQQRSCAVHNFENIKIQTW